MQCWYNAGWTAIFLHCASVPRPKVLASGLPSEQVAEIKDRLIDLGNQLADGDPLPAMDMRSCKKWTLVIKLCLEN
jgi:hypothetical protein